MSTDADLFAQAASLQGLPAEPAPTSATPIDVEQALADHGVDSRVETIRADVRQLAAEVLVIVRAAALKPQQRGDALYHLEHARKCGALYSVTAAIKALREGA